VSSASVSAALVGTQEPEYGPANTPQEKLQWMRDARFGMFIHWGLYAVLGHGEQPLYRELLNPSEYRKLADRFQADKWDPDDWMRTAQAAGMKYAVLTAKHHDGFCLWDTKTTDYNAVKLGPHQDLVAGYVKACRQAGLRVGLYFSLADWNVPAHFAGPKKDPEGWARFIAMTHRQVEELVTQYGQVDLLWFDGANYFTGDDWQSGRLATMIFRHQPHIIINNRLPKPSAGGAWGYDTPEQRIGGFSTNFWESCITSTRKFWGYHVCHEDPTMWYPEREVLDTFVRTMANNGNLLWNVGPRADGTLPALYKQRTRLVGDWLRKNGESIYGTVGAPFEFAYGGVMTRRDNVLYLCFLYWPGPEYSVCGFKQKLTDARFLDGGRKVEAVQEPHRIILKNMPRKAPDLVTVVKLTFAAVPEPHEWATKRLWQINLEGMEDWAKR
jgi:alpha-L-fucosidase